MNALLGFGVSGPHGARWFAEKKLTRLIAQAIDGGVRDFDTAPFYGDAQLRLGRALRSIGARDMLVSTKTGTLRAGLRAVKDFSANAIRADVEGSLKDLGREFLDTLYLHGPAPAEIDAAIPVLRALQAEGTVRRIGVCGEGAALDHALASGFDAIMGVFNVIDRRHEGVFSRARARGVQTVAIAPLAQGAFAKQSAPRSASDAWRLARATMRGGARSKSNAEKKASEALSAVESLSPSGAALAFVLQGGLASLALTTTSNAAHLAESLAAANHSLDVETMARLTALALDPAGRRS